MQWPAEAGQALAEHSVATSDTSTQLPQLAPARPPKGVKAGQRAQKAQRRHRLVPQCTARVKLQMGEALQGREGCDPLCIDCWEGRRGGEGSGSWDLLSTICLGWQGRLSRSHALRRHCCSVKVLVVKQQVQRSSPALPTLSVRVTARSEVAAAATTASASPSHPMPLLACRLLSPDREDSAAHAGTFGATWVYPGKCRSRADSWVQAAQAAASVSAAVWVTARRSASWSSRRWGREGRAAATASQTSLWMPQDCAAYVGRGGSCREGRLARARPWPQHNGRHLTHVHGAPDLHTTAHTAPPHLHSKCRQARSTPQRRMQRLCVVEVARGEH